MTPFEAYRQEMEKRARTYPSNGPLQQASQAFFNEIGVGRADYVYNFFWLGVPVIQLPQDLQAFQEIIWETKPDLIIETGIAWGGSLLFSASMLAVLEACRVIDKGHVLGIDIEIRPHNRKAIAAHPLSNKITMLQGSSVDAKIVSQVEALAADYSTVMVFLDSNHTHDHVLAELEVYAPLVTPGSYCVVGDTVIEDAPSDMVSQRSWGKGNSPKTAVREYLKRLKEEGRTASDGDPLRLEMDRVTERKILVTGSPDGYLRRIAE